MTTLTEGKHAGEFIGESAMGDAYHNDAGTVITGQNLVSGTVVGIITASGKFTILAPAAGTGEQTAAGIMYDACNATAADKAGVVVRRGPMLVNGNDLTWPGGITGPQKTTAIAQLAAIGIKVL
jgi:hypothetical protein